MAVELRKARAAHVPWATGALLALGVGVLSGAMVLAARTGRTDVVAKLGPEVASGDWTALLSVATQVAAAASVLAAGVVASWSTGREFTDATVAGLFGLPVTRAAVARAKLMVDLVWGVVVALAVVGVVLAVGLLLGLGAPDAATAAALARLGVLVALSAMLALPAAWAATAGRGVLPGVAVAVGILVVAQIGVVVGAGPWMPLAAPALWALSPGSVPAGALLLVPVLPALFAVATVAAWRRLQLDR